MAVMKIIWDTAEDERVCPVCMPLHGQVWLFDTKSDTFPNRLVSPRTGKPVWDTLRDRPMTHGGTPINCRCRLIITFNVEEIREALHEKLLWAVQIKDQIDAL